MGIDPKEIMNDIAASEADLDQQWAEAVAWWEDHRPHALSLHQGMNEFTGEALRDFLNMLTPGMREVVSRLCSTALHEIATRSVKRSVMERPETGTA